MNKFRYWLADLISGGELTRHRSAAKDRVKKVDYILERLDLAEYALVAMDEGNSRHISALRQIAAEVKPTSNATVKRMGRIAEDALK